MFELEKYASNGHFFFSKGKELKQVCNAPTSGLGVYVVYKLQHGKIELVYIGSSGQVNQKGEPESRIGGLYDRIVNGKQFGQPRRVSWNEKLIQDDIDALDIYWYETFSQRYKDIPSVVEGIMLQQHFEMFGRLPKWNKKV